MKKQKQGGFTLIEIAIVLVIIGLLLGGVLKGQELITSARVRNLISQQDGIKAAYFGFLDRYRALPGDYTAAATNITGVAAGACGTHNGNGNGQIEAGNESVQAWEHLSKSGFINGAYTCNTTENPPAAPATTPTNPYGTRLQVIYDAVYDGAPVARHNVKSGNQIPSDIMAEVDRKADDGNAQGGTFRFSAYAGGGVAPTAANCYAAAAPFGWASQTVATNCGGASLF